MINTLESSEYTAFISYAHADDVAWFNWVSLFRKELERGLAATMRGVTLPPVHLSGDNGPVAGVLGPELRERIDKSFAMVVVVHDNYVLSEWCLKELEYFTQRFGEEGCRDRLYIVAMSEPAVQTVAASPAWKKMLPAGQLWMPFFDESKHAEPVEIYMGPELVTPRFREMFVRLRQDFVGKLKGATASLRPPIVSAPPPSTPPPTPDADTGGAVAPPSAAPAPAPASVPAPAVMKDVRIYIESNRHEVNLWQPLGEQMRRRWDRLAASASAAADAAGPVAGAASAAVPTPGPALSLRARGLPVDQIDSFPSLDDADGVVLLWGRKTSEALVAQINKVENKMSPGRDAAPGVVAYLMPPQQSTEPVPAWGWQVLRFNAPTQTDIDVVAEEDDELQQFLRRVLERRLLREAAPGMTRQP